MNQFLKTESEITQWLDRMGVKNYTLEEDSQYGFVVNVLESVDLDRKNITHLPVKFNRVEGYFSCSNNALTSLQGVPDHVGDSFFCSYNQLPSLKDCPQRVGGSFSCQYNHLTSLEGCPQNIKGLFMCSQNSIADLLVFPQFVSLDVKLDHNPLLGEAQNIKDFQTLYDIHLSQVIGKEKKYLQCITSSSIKDHKTNKI